VSVNVPNCDSQLSRFNPDFWYDPPYRLWGFGRTTLKKLLENAGFEVVRIESGHFYIGQLWCVARKPG